MMIKILKLIIIFIACIPFYIAVQFIYSKLITGNFNMEEALMYSTSFAFAWTSIVGYKWFKVSNRKKKKQT